MAVSSGIILFYFNILKKEADKMTSTMLSPNYMIKSFPRNPLPAVREDVTYPDIIELLKSIKENYKSVDSL